MMLFSQRNHFRYAVEHVIRLVSSILKPLSGDMKTEGAADVLSDVHLPFADQLSKAVS